MSSKTVFGLTVGVVVVVVVGVVGEVGGEDEGGG
jgi:hypothetical protein